MIGFSQEIMVGRLVFFERLRSLPDFAVEAAYLCFVLLHSRCIHVRLQSRRMHLSPILAALKSGSQVNLEWYGSTNFPQEPVTHKRQFPVRCDADELRRTPLGYRPWRLYRVPEDQIEPIDSDWKQILPAPGIHIAGKSHGMYRVAIDDSYVAWLFWFKFKFQPDFDPLKPVDEEVSAHGEQVATRNAVARFHRDAVKAIFSRKSPQLDSCYRNLPKVPHQVALEWAILKRDMVTAS